MPIQTSNSRQFMILIASIDLPPLDTFYHASKRLSLKRKALEVDWLAKANQDHRNHEITSVATALQTRGVGR